MHHKQRSQQRRHGTCSARSRASSPPTRHPSFGVIYRRDCGARAVQLTVRACPAEAGQWIAEATWDTFAPRAGDGTWPGASSTRHSSRSEAMEAASSAALRQIAQQLGMGKLLEDARAWVADMLWQVRLEDETLPAHGVSVADLAAGGLGSLGLGFTLMGAHVALACEIDPEARRVYETNVKPAQFWDDLRTLDPAKLRGIDVITMGLDCRSLSRSGGGRGFRDPVRASLYDSCLGLLRSSDAKLVLIECAPDLLSPKHYADAERLRCTLRAAGYRVQQRVLDASRFGLAQVRERTFIVATRGVGLPEALGFAFPQERPRSAVVADILDPSPATIPASEVHPHRPEPATRGTAPVQVGCIGGKQMQGYRVYATSSPGITITASGGGRARFTGAYAVPGGARTLTPREAYRMQGAPEWTSVHPVHRHAMRHAGNAVALPIAREFARIAGGLLLTKRGEE